MMDALKSDLSETIGDTSGIDYLTIGVDGDEAYAVLCGRDAPTEHANEGEALATVSTHDGGETYAVQTGVGEANGGYTVTDLQATDLSLDEAVALAAEHVRA
jgi:hypothetical protein